MSYGDPLPELGAAADPELSWLDSYMEAEVAISQVIEEIGGTVGMRNSRSKTVGPIGWANHYRPITLLRNPDNRLGVWGVSLRETVERLPIITERVLLDAVGDPPMVITPRITVKDVVRRRMVLNSERAAVRLSIDPDGLTQYEVESPGLLWYEMNEGVGAVALQLEQTKVQRWLLSTHAAVDPLR